MTYRINKPDAGPALYRGVGGAVARVVDAILSPIAPRMVVGRQRARIESAAMLK